MRIHEITFNNFRRFYGDQSFELSATNNKNITLINAQNGLGKTNILNAILWCFHGITTTGFKQKDLILNIDAKKEGSYLAKVEIRFEHNDKNYLVQRHHNINKSGSDKEITKVHLFSDGGMEALTNTHLFLNSVLPRSMAEYFLFDGEHAINFLGENNSKNVSEATKNILGFEAILMALDDLKIVAKEINKQLQIAPNDKSIAENSKKRDGLVKQIEIAKKTTSQMDETVKTLDNQIREIDKKLKNTAGAEEIQKRREQLNKDLTREKDRKSKSDIELVNWIERNAIAAVSTKITNIAKDYIKTQESKGKIPSPYNETLITELLEMGECICGRHLDAESPERKNIAKLMKNASTIELSSRLAACRSEISVFADRQKDFTDNYNTIIKSIGSSQSNINNIEQSIAECSIQLKNVDIDNIKEMEDSRTAADAKKSQQLMEKGAIVRNIIDTEEEIKELTTVIVNASKKNVEAQRLNKKYELTNNVIEEIERILDEEQIKARIEIAELVNSRLNKIAAKELICVVNDDFSVKLITKSSGQHLPMSGGETQMLSLCFTAALVEFSKKRQKNINDYLLSGTTAPLILDAPFSNLDRDYLAGVAKIIPEMADQVIFLATEKQIDSNLRNELKDKIGKQYVLINYTTTSAPHATKSMTVDNKEIQILIENQPFDKTEIHEVK
jgi:DNA sulfur modification protein DndD